MLEIQGRTLQLCDRIQRRTFLQVGALGLGGLSLPDLLRAEDQSGRGSSHRSVIMVFLTGGPPHQDMVDLKPDAPLEYRGEFSPIPTNVSGINICEHLPRIAQRMDRMAVIRTLVGSEGRHAAFQCLHGHPVRNQPPGGWPCLGSAVSKLQGPVNQEIPACVSLQLCSMLVPCRAGSLCMLRHMFPRAHAAPTPRRFERCLPIHLRGQCLPATALTS